MANHVKGPNPNRAQGPLDPTFGPLLRHRRLRLKMTIRELSVLSGVGDNTISRIETRSVRPNAKLKGDLTAAIELAEEERKATQDEPAIVESEDVGRQARDAAPEVLPDPPMMAREKGRYVVILGSLGFGVRRCFGPFRSSEEAKAFLRDRHDGWGIVAPLYHPLDPVES